MQPEQAIKKLWISLLQPSHYSDVKLTTVSITMKNSILRTLFLMITLGASGYSIADIVNGFDCGYAGTRYLADVDGDGNPDYCRTVGDSPNTFVSCAKGLVDGRFKLGGETRLSLASSTGNATCPASNGKVTQNKPSTPVIAEDWDLMPPPPPPPFMFSEGDFVVTKVYVDNVMQPKNLLDIAKDCDNNPQCKLVAKAAAEYFQLPIDKTISGMAYLAPAREGEGWHSTVTLPAGYQYCTSSMRMVSIVPHDGPRGSLWRGATQLNGMYLESWTPKQTLFGGNSWVESEVTLVGVKENVAFEARSAGKCNSAAAGRSIWYCRGGGCNNVDDKGQSVPTSYPPGAMSHN